ncbi:MAG: CRISPR-associated protein Csy2 [Paraglaciecola sp.]|jgi:CRISPR-associated protein Csy2
MSQYLVLSRISVQNANSIAGLTWGFPAITQFLGFTHALSRKISTKYKGTYETELTGCAVISHTTQNKVYQPKVYADFEFLQSKNPPVLAKHKNASPPIIEEGKLNLTVSLVIELAEALTLTTEQVKQFESLVSMHCECMRLAGGTILDIGHIKLLSASTQVQQKQMLRKIKRLTMPGFALLDCSDYLNEYFKTLLTKTDKQESSPTLLGAWLDFAALKSKAVPSLKEGQVTPDENTPAQWMYLSKPKIGYLVPLMMGYKAISDLYDAGEVLNTRDPDTKSCFVEAIHSVGEWKGTHAIKSIGDIIWRYHLDGNWYLCTQKKPALSTEKTSSVSPVADEIQFNNMNDALNFLGK